MTRLQIDDAKIPAQMFAVRCPKCQVSISVLPQSAPAAEAAPARTPSGDDASDSSFTKPVSAPPFRRAEDQGNSGAATAEAGLNDLTKLLNELLRNNGNGNGSPGVGRRRASDRRKVLICSSPAYRETIAELLTDKQCEVFVAEDLPQALGRMREERMDVVVLDADFDPLEQGVAFITREIRLLRPTERRRIFFVYVTSGVRTMDLHAAFLQDVNLVVNPSDIEQLADALEISIRHFNELYLPLHNALGVAPI